MRFKAWLSETWRLVKPVRKPLLVSWLISVMETLSLLVVYATLQPEIPFFYTRANPVEYLAPKAWLFLLPGLSFGINVLHFGLLHTLRSGHKVLRELFVWATLIIQLLLAVALLRIVWLVL